MLMAEAVSPVKQVHTSRGKWSQPGVPHKGWTCVGVEDLEEPSKICEMCESVEIRYVHSMEHPEYPVILDVGCVCAEHMEGDYVTPREREATLRKASRRRANWGKRTWHLSQNGNHYLNVDGFNLQVYPTSGRSPAWMIAVVNRTTLVRQQGRRSYRSADDAKRAAFDALLWAKKHL
jgi:hypothetical protein